MPWVRGFVVLLGLFLAGFMTFDGLHAVVTGDYVTPSAGPFAGRLGPWQGVVEAAGIPARSALMKLIFITYGITWLVATYCFAKHYRWGRAFAILMAVCSLWWLGPGTFLALTQLLFLILLPPNRPLPVADPVPPPAPVEPPLVESTPAETAAPPPSI